MNRSVYLLSWATALLLSGACLAQSVPANVSNYEAGLRKFLSTSQPTDAKSNDADYIVAMVNSDIVTYQDIKSRWEKIQKAYPDGKIPSQERNEVLYRVVDELVTERLYSQAAKLAGVVVDDTAVDNFIGNIAKQNNLSVTQLRDRLGSEGLTYEQFRAQIHSQILTQKVRERFTDGRPAITDRAVESEMSRLQINQLPPSFQINLAHLLFTVPEDATAEQDKAAQALAQSVAQKAKAGMDFAELAAMPENRAAKQDAKGMGLRDMDRYPSLFIDAVAQLAVGGVTDPIKSGAGYHVLKVLEKKESPVVLITVTETRARHILLRASNPIEIEQASAQMAALRDEIVSGRASFSQIARRVSQDGSAQAGGDLGWTTPGLYVPEFEKPMMQLPIGQVSAPVVSRFGVHLIEVVDRREARLPRSVLRERVLGHLRDAKAQDNLKAFHQELRERAYFEWREAPRL